MEITHGEMPSSLRRRPVFWEATLEISRKKLFRRLHSSTPRKFFMSLFTSDASFSALCSSAMLQT
ncbi:hypothetical protein Plhal710r2_c034g0122951 [Plasmopara halstedii]